LEGYPAGFSEDLGASPGKIAKPVRARNEFLLTSEQLLAARATQWRQKAEPLITLDDAQSWLLQVGLCLFLPRKAQIPAPAPSFVEACLGETNPTPRRAAIEVATNLLARLIEANSALPLNLLGTPSDHPDFLVSTEALPFVYALRGDRDWKRAPGTAGANRVSPLITHVWQLLERRGVLSAGEIQDELGKELTEAAVLRALHELWASLRVIPLYQAGGQQTLWEPLQSRHHKAIASGVGMSQVTALSVLASVYLQSVVAAAGDDAESFLSPLASRAKVREVIRGLTATRQLSLIQMETQSLLYVEGSLPEFPEAEKPAAIESETAKSVVGRPHPTSPQSMEASLRRSVPGSAARPAYKRPAAANSEGLEKRAARPAQRPPGGSFRPAAGSRPDTRQRESGYRPSAGSPQPFKPRTTSAERPAPRSEPGTGLRPDGTPKKPRWRDLPGGRPDQKGKPKRFSPRKAEGVGEGQIPRPAPRREAGSPRPAEAARPSSAGPSSVRPSFRGKPAGSDRGAPARPPFRPAASRPAGGGSRPPARSGAPRFASGAASARPFQRPRREEGARSARPTRPGAPSGDRKFTPRPPRPGGFSSSRPRTGESRPYSPRPGIPSRPPARAGTGSGRPPSGRPAGAKPFNRTGSGFKPGGRPAGASFKPASSGAGGPSRRGSRPSGVSQGPRPGAGRFGAGGGRPRPASGAKPGARPPAKFKKPPKPGE
jgi:23S rRNA pseudouridine2605 synthase